MHITTPYDLSPTERQKIRDFLMGHPVGVLATVDTDGNPNASTIYFGVDEALNITFTTKRDTNKHNNISHNSKVMLAVYDSESQVAVQAAGEAREVTDPEVAHSIYQGTLHAAKQTGEDTVPPIAKIAAGPYVAYVVKSSNIWISEYGWGDSFANALAQANEPNIGGDPA